MKTALVTGATGLLGSYVVERLVADGWRVRALVRDPARDRWIADLGAAPVPGDILDDGSLRQAARGCDGVIHAAARVGSGGSTRAFLAGNVGGTLRVLDAAARAGARLVHVSSTAVYGGARYRARLTDEDDPLPRLPARDRYGRSKQEAERAVLDAHARGRVWATVVRPTVMYGRRDRQLAPRVAPILSRGAFPLLGGGGTTLNMVHASAVADGAVRALGVDDAAGAVFNLARDFDLTVRDFVRLAGLGLGRRVPTIRVPVAVGRLGFAALAVALAAVGRRDLAGHAAGTFRMLTRDNPFASERARTVLGWSPVVHPESGVPEAFRAWQRFEAVGTPAWAAS